MRRGCQSRGRVGQPLKKPSNQDEAVVAMVRALVSRFVPRNLRAALIF